MHHNNPILLLSLSLSLLPNLSLSQSTTILVAAPVSTSSSYTSGTQYRDDMLFAHNFYRAAHNASALTWNETLADVAREWSEGCEFEHSGGPSGENLAVGYPNATANVDAWALERTMYSWRNPGFASATGHFTQLVWRNTTSVGCGRTNCDGQNNIQGWLVVCEYSPAGNVLGAGGSTQYFRDNVLEQVEGRATDTVGSGVSESSGTGWKDGRWGAGMFVAAAVVGLGMAW